MIIILRKKGFNAERATEYLSLLAFFFFFAVAVSLLQIIIMLLWWILTCQGEIWGFAVFLDFIRFFGPSPSVTNRLPSWREWTNQRQSWWIFMSPRFKPLSEFVLVHSIIPRTFHGHKLHFLMNGKRKNLFGLNWDPSFTEIIEGKQQKRDKGNRQKRWQWLRFQKVLIALPQEKPFSWSLDPRVNKCRLPPCLTDTIPCTVYILQVTHSTTATVQPRRSPDPWVIHT